MDAMRHFSASIELGGRRSNWRAIGSISWLIGFPSECGGDANVYRTGQWFASEKRLRCARYVCKTVIGRVKATTGQLIHIEVVENSRRNETASPLLAGGRFADCREAAYAFSSLAAACSRALPAASMASLLSASGATHTL